MEPYSKYLSRAVCIVPVSAVDDVFTDNNGTYAAVANDAVGLGAGYFMDE
jgi:hypothetical protein